MKKQFEIQECLPKRRCFALSQMAYSRELVRDAIEALEQYQLLSRNGRRGNEERLREVLNAAVGALEEYRQMIPAMEIEGDLSICPQCPVEESRPEDALRPCWRNISQLKPVGLSGRNNVISNTIRLGIISQRNARNSPSNPQGPNSGTCAEGAADRN